jgi:hypothetical protein
MSELRAVLNSDQTIKAVLNSDQTVKAVLLSGVTVNQKIDGGEYIHFDVTSNGNNQIFTTSTLNQYISAESINLFKNGVYIPPTNFQKVGNTSIRMNIPLVAGDTLDILATGSAALVPVANSTPGGTNEQVQFNNVGSLDGSSDFTFNVGTGTTTMTNANVGSANIGNLNVANINISNFAPPNVTSNNATFQNLTVTQQSNLANVAVLGNLQITGNIVGNVTFDAITNLGLPQNVKISGGLNGYVLQTDGAGNLSWTAQTGGGGGNGVPGGSNSQVQYNDSGVFGGSSAFTFNEVTNTLSATNIAGTLTTASQPNITSLGVLSNVQVSGVANAGIVRTNNLQYANGSPYAFSANPGGSNTQVQFNDGGVLGASSAFTFNRNTNTLTVTNIAGNGSQLANVNANTANTATTAQTVTNNSQPNITSVGTLTSLAVSGNITAGNVSASHFGSGAGLTNLPAANIVGSVSNAQFAANANFATNAGQAATANIATLAQTLTGASQPNITSLGTLVSLNVSGSAAAGSIRTDNLQYSNGVPWVFNTYGNADVANYLPTYTGALQPSILATGTAQITGGFARSMREPVQLLGSAIGTQILDIANNTLYYFNNPTTGPVTLSLRANSTTTFNAFLPQSQSLTFSVILRNPTSPGSISTVVTGILIDGTSTPINWLGQIPENSVGGFDVYVFTIIKDNTNAYVVLGNKGSTQ